ncbi:hypothetical protein [Brevibacillus laterosporus]|uniref:glycoside hydrolase family 78 protein n=1 Tax=Brevibacillus laterosporus TaxID=1465 RepID=UPI003D20B6CA
MDSRIKIAHKWSFDKDSNLRYVDLKKGDLIIGFVRSPKSNVTIDITSNKGNISYINRIAYNTYGGIVDSIAAVIYTVTSDVSTTLTFSSESDTLKYAMAAIFRNAELIAFESKGHKSGTPEQVLPANKHNGMGVLLVNRHTPNAQTSLYKELLEIKGAKGDETAGSGSVLVLDNIRKQYAMPPDISHGADKYSAAIAVLLATAIVGPDKPTNLNPAGTISSPVTVDAAFTISWSYSSPDVGSAQKYYQVVIQKKIDDRAVYNTGMVESGSGTHKVTANLQPDTEYYYIVRVWDQYNNDSLESDRQYFKTYKAPTSTPLSPVGSRDKPEGASLAPTLEWKYYDPQGKTQTHFDIVVKRVSDNSTALYYTVPSTQSHYEVSAGKLEAGMLYSWSVRVQSDSFWSEWTPEQYFITNIPPSPPTLTLPVNTYRTDVNPIFEAIAGSDPENDRQGFVIELALDEQFTQDTRVYNSKTDFRNWSYHDGHEWQPFDDYTLSNDTVKGKKIRFDMLESEPLVKNKTYYWRMAGVDGTTEVAGAWSTTHSIRVGNVLQFQLKEPIMDKVEAHRLVMNAVYKIANDGANPARLLVEVSNNAFDDSPTWEDMTQAFLNRDYLELQNRLKQADKWGLNVRITVFANDSLGPIEFDAFGFSYD